jgi:DnaJ-domain-containing protein 1
MPPVVHRITERNVRDVFERSPYVLAIVDRTPNAALPKGLAAYFDQRAPERFTFGSFWRGEWATERLDQMLRSSVGALRNGIRDGLYLCEAGTVIAFHGGQLRPSSASWAADPDERAARERVDGSPARAGLTAVELERLHQLVAYFDPILERRQRAGGDSNPYVYTHTEPPPAPVPPPVTDEAYAVLGVAVTATDDEVKAAYREQLKLNHPDKVAHLSPALQQFAQQQTLKVRAAWDAIAARRGIR